MLEKIRGKIVNPGLPSLRPSWALDLAIMLGDSDSPDQRVPDTSARNSFSLSIAHHYCRSLTDAGIVGTGAQRKLETHSSEFRP
jgi:hypothetical protein